MYYPYRSESPRVMTVIGTAKLSHKPDTVSIQLEVMTENEQLQQTQQENAFKMNRVIQALLQAGLSKENIQTSSYSIHPKYDYVDGKQVFKGYQVSNSITVKINNLNLAGQLIDIAVKNGANHVSNIQFALDNQQKIYQEALSMALKNALIKAQTIAETIKVKVDPTPIKIVEEISEMPHLMQKFSVAENSMTTPIEPGEMVIQAKVEVQMEYYG
ncbi:MAG: SIMPL domain-containing protein [Heyndrickxia sp.]